MPEPEPQLSYEDYLQTIGRAEEMRQAWLRRDKGSRPPASPVHPFGGDLPPTGNDEYDNRRPYQQVSSRAAIDLAGFDPGKLEHYRRALEADPYGPALHIAEPGGPIRPAVENAPTAADVLRDERGAG